MARRLATALASLCLACAHAQPAPAEAEPPHPILLLPRSSIAAILAHRGDLELTDEQAQRLEERDGALEQRQAALRAAFGHQEEGKAKAASDSSGMGMGHHHGQPQRLQANPNRLDPKALLDRLDDNDTHAYLAAETAVLTDKQRDPAREIAEKYREDLYDQRDQLERLGRR